MSRVPFRLPSYVDPKALFDDFLSKYKVLFIPLNGGWFTDNAGSGIVSQLPMMLYVNTGTTANSRALAYCNARVLNSGDLVTDRIDFSKQLEIIVHLTRSGNDPECVGRFQLKTVTSEGALSDKGLGLEFQNFDVYGESYGTARGTVSLGTIPYGMVRVFKIVLVPSSRVEFWVNGSLAGTLTGDHVPTGTTTAAYFVVSIINGPTGGVSATIQPFHIMVIQEW